MKAKRQAKKAERKSKRAERKYDESMAYNKNLSPEARLHYLENERADKDGVSMYGKGPNLEPITMGIIKGATIAASVLPVIGPPAVKLGKKALSGLETLGAGKGFSKGFNMKNKDAFKNLSKGVGEIAKTDVGKELKQKGITALDKLIKESGKALKGVKMTGKEKGPDLLGMGKKETKGALGGAGLGMLALGPLGAIAGGLAGKAFGKGRDRKEAEEGAGANMMGNSISKHMGGRGANMYGDGAEMLGMRKVRKENLKDMREHGENLRDIAMTPTRIISKVANFVSGDDPQTPKEARQERRQERRSARQERKLAKAGGANMKGKKPMMKGGENVIVRDAKSGGKNQYNKRGK